jgi:hypothetical protein
MIERIKDYYLVDEDDVLGHDLGDLEININSGSEDDLFGDIDFDDLGDSGGGFSFNGTGLQEFDL